MAPKRSKRANRLISYLCILGFALSLVCVAIFGVALIKENIKNRQLLEQQQALTEEYNHLQELYNNVDDDGYFNVYTDGEMIVYGNGSTITIQ